MTIALWIVQILLALAFLLAGFMKVSQPIDNLKKNMGWAGLRIRLHLSFVS